MLFDHPVRRTASYEGSEERRGKEDNVFVYFKKVEDGEKYKKVSDYIIMC